MARSHLLGITALVFAVLLAGCVHDEYSIELTPQDNVMRRELTVRRVGGDDAEVSPETLDAIAELYPREVRTDVEGAHAFVGEFAYAMPEDVGGAGEYITFATPIGRSSAYIERFRGDDSPAERIQAALDAVDELTDLLIGWLEGELGEYEDFPKLRAFLDEQFRTDLKNLSAYLFLLDSASSAEWTEDNTDDQIEKEVIAHIAQYFIERQYFPPAEVPAVLRTFQEITPDDEVAALCPFIVNIIQRKADLQDEDMLAALGELLAADPVTLEESLAAYITTTEQYQQLLAQWEQLHDESPEPDPLDVLSERVQAIMLWDLDILASNDMVKVVLHDVTNPVATNGLWDEYARTISWSNRLNSTSLPAICYAVWAEPDVEFQTQHFGKVILDAKDLLGYCLWYNSLTDEESAEWDEMIDRMQPDDESSLEALKAFQFSHEPAIDPEDAENLYAKPGTYASMAIDTLVRNLAADEADEPDEPDDTPPE